MDDCSFSVPAITHPPCTNLATVAYGMVTMTPGGIGWKPSRKYDSLPSLVIFAIETVLNPRRITSCVIASITCHQITQTGIIHLFGVIKEAESFLSSLVTWSVELLVVTSWTLLATAVV
jgi:hypothetical protein